MIEKATDIAKELMLKMDNLGLAIDMTAGNGHDSKFILDELKPIKLYAFDIQDLAKEATTKLIGDRDDFDFILDSHANIDKYINEPVDLVVYNLGYLPKGDKSLTTKTASTLESLDKVLKLLTDKGRIIITAYPGHPEGAAEAESLGEFLAGLDQKEFTVIKIAFTNKINKPPFTYVIGRKL